MKPGALPRLTIRRRPVLEPLSEDAIDLDLSTPPGMVVMFLCSVGRSAWPMAQGRRGVSIAEVRGLPHGR